jgi:2,3-bisphosphoglycerate-dependent phosphoglycerate mutase
VRAVLLVRHCESTGPAPEAPLTIAGREQARRLAERLRPLDIDHVVSSPFARARQTIAPLALARVLPVHLDDRLVERRLAAAPVAQLPEEVRRSFDDLDHHLPGGESGRDAQTRGRAVLDELLTSAHRLPLAVTHGQLLAWILRSIDGSFGFEGWRALASPDVFRIDLGADGVRRFTRLPSA